MKSYRQMTARFGGILLLAAAMTIGAVSTAQAVPITGGFSKSGTFRPVNGATGVTTTLGLATGLDFLTVVDPPGSATPGVPGGILVNSASGSFLATPGFLGATGAINDFSFAGGGSAAFPTVPVSPLEFALPGGTTFDLLTVTLDFQSNAILALTGSGLFHMTGFDDTPGSFVFSGNQAGGTFSFSASQAADAVPEPATLALFGLGLFGVGSRMRRTRK